MRLPNDPIRSIKRTIKLIWLLGCIAIIACTTWAILPLDNSNANSFTFDLQNPAQQESIDAVQAFDHSVFAANLWNTPPKKPAETKITKKESPRAKPLRLQLIGITSDGKTLKAAIYDPDSDQLLIVANGQSILGRTVSKITKNTVVIADGSFTLHLKLVRDEGDKGDDGS